MDFCPPVKIVGGGEGALHIPARPIRLCNECLAAPQQENDPVISNNTFKFRILNEDDVFNVLQTMDISKATGADNISAKVLKTAAPYISNVYLTYSMNAISTVVFRRRGKRRE
jgi:hypothetical protein